MPFKDNIFIFQEVEKQYTVFMQSATTLEVYILVITQLVVNTHTMVNGSLSMMPGRLSYLLNATI